MATMCREWNSSIWYLLWYTMKLFCFYEKIVLHGSIGTRDAGYSSLVELSSYKEWHSWSKIFTWTALFNGREVCLENVVVNLMSVLLVLVFMWVYFVLFELTLFFMCYLLPYCKSNTQLVILGNPYFKNIVVVFAEVFFQILPDPFLAWILSLF